MQYPPNSNDIPDHLADTGPSQAVRESYRTNEISGCRRTVGLLSLIGALGLTAAAAFLLTLPPPTDTPTPNPASTIVVITSDAPAATALPTTIAPTQNINPDNGGDSNNGIVMINVLPTIAPDELFSLLATPIVPLNYESPNDQLQIPANLYDPYTIIPERPRSEVIQYEVQSGDTMFRIAETFGLKPESIAWSNERSIIGGLRPGRVINIPPVDGVYYTVVSDNETIAEVASRFRVEPFTIIDSEYNNFFNMQPDSTLTSGMHVMIPGGTAESIVWSPPVERVGGDSTRGGAGGQISFAQGDPGSCGFVSNPGGGASWVSPLRAGTYQWTRGYDGIHTGVDLAGAVGTPIYAANSGTVIFAGWNTYGYGYLVVLAHGAYTTVYGHLSAINVGCGQSVGAGQVVGAMGASGNASGPHLHFEIRYNDVAQNPTSAIAF